jgi:hypothetical protein
MARECGPPRWLDRGFAAAAIFLRVSVALCAKNLLTQSHRDTEESESHAGSCATSAGWPAFAGHDDGFCEFLTQPLVVATMFLMIEDPRAGANPGGARTPCGTRRYPAGRPLGGRGVRVRAKTTFKPLGFEDAWQPQVGAPEGNRHAQKSGRYAREVRAFEARCIAWKKRTRALLELAELVLAERAVARLAPPPCGEVETRSVSGGGETWHIRRPHPKNRLASLDAFSTSPRGEVKKHAETSPSSRHTRGRRAR